MENAANALGLTSWVFPDGLARTMSPACGGASNTSDVVGFFSRGANMQSASCRVARDVQRRGESGAEPSFNSEIGDQLELKDGGLEDVVRLLAKTGFVQAGLSQLAPPMVTGP